MVQTEKSSNGTQLTARLRDAAGERVIADFRIRCDRVETADNGDMRATGNVSFVGTGWKGTCRSLTIPIGQPRLVFERDVEIAQDVLGRLARRRIAARRANRLGAACAERTA